MLYLITGGSGSGKSSFAEDLVVRLSGDKRYYIATMKPFGDEGRERVERHRLMRQDKGFTTIECYTGIKTLDYEKNSVYLLECMSNLVANEMFDPEGAKDRTVEEIIMGMETLLEQTRDLVVVTNEVFSDGFLYEDDMKSYLTRLGTINQWLAARAEHVIEVVYSIPVFHKGGDC